MDSDDAMHPERLARQVAFLDGTPEVDLVGTGFTLVEGDMRSPRRQPTKDGMIKALLLNCIGNAIHNPTVMLRTVFLRERGLGYPTILTDHDHALWVAMLKAGARFANLDEDLFTYNKHDANYTRTHAEAYRRGKLPIQRDLLLALYPDLAAREATAIAALMVQGGRHEISDTFAGLHAIERMARMAGAAHGADHHGVCAVLAKHREKALDGLRRAFPGDG